VAITTIFALTAAPANASFLIFQCGADQNLCRINPDGTGLQQITSDGSPTAGYHWPSLSRDGTRMSWIRGNGDLFIGDAAAHAAVGPIERTVKLAVIRPDGAQIGGLVLSSVFTGLYAYIYNADGTTAFSGPQPDGYSIGWATDNNLLLPLNNPSTPTIGICVAVPNPAGGTDCGTRVASDPSFDLAFPTVSPDGSTLAVIAENRSDSGGHIALYDYNSHALLRDVTSGTQDQALVWSPDGSQLAFVRAEAGGPAIYVTSAGGAPGSERRIATGDTPTWGGPIIAGHGLTASKTQRGSSVRIKLTVDKGPATVDVRLTGSSKTKILGRTVKRGVPAGPVTIKVRLNKAGKKALKRKRRLKLKVRVAVSTAGAQTTTMTAKVTLKR
ncbi:MAG: hypothetical protein Q7R41_12565, partial [Phycisphaerales bacterium]|nr:hypothetical protein [Phycisphaerales bacterium]